MKPAKVHYIHSLSYSARDKLAGTFVLIALLLLFGLFASKVKLSKIFDSVVNYQAVMKNAQGITAETAINISGIDVGRVSDIFLDENNNVKVHFFIYERFQPLVRRDSTGEVSRLSIVGDNIIIIKAGSPEQPMLTDNATISIKEPTVTNFLSIAEITPTIKKFSSLVTILSETLETINPQTIKNSSQNIQTVLADLSKITQQIASGKGSLGRVLYDKKQEQHMLKSLALLEKSLFGISQRVNEIQPMIANTNQLALKTTEIVHNAAKLSSESQQLMVSVRKSVEKVDQQINQLPTLINSAQSILQSTEHTLNGFKPVHVYIDNQIWPFSSTPTPVKKQLLIKDTGLNE